MRPILRSFLVAFLTLCATQAFTACGGLSDDNTDNNDGVTQVTTEIPQANQLEASNPVITPSNDNSSDGIGTLNQGLYTGPSLKLPLPAGYAWRLHTEVGGYTWCDNLIPGPACDSGHTGNSFYSLDFGRFAQDVVNPNNKDGVPLDNSTEKGVIDVLAAAGGTVLDTTDPVTKKPGLYPLVTSGCKQWGTTCQVHINHGGDYITSYLHFKTDTIKVVPGQWVAQGQSLGKMGNTGASTGTHLHFQVRYKDNSSDGNLALEGVTLEGKSFKDYKFLNFYSSTNGFTYDPQNGANPRTCFNGITRVNASTFTCTLQSAFNFYRHVYSDVVVRKIQRDLCLKAEVWLAGVKTSYEVPQYCSNGITPGNGLYYNNTNYFTTAKGSGQVKYFARNNLPGASYLPAPFATVPFTVLNGGPNVNNGQLAPINTLPAHQSAVKGPNPSFAWADQGPLAVTTDHDMYFWYWNGSGWAKIGWVFGWPSSNVIVTGLPTSKYILWQVRSCGLTGCSKWSNATYFYLQP